MSFRKLHVLPALLCGWFLSTFIILYIYAVLSKDVEPVFPYISDTGTWVPESCIFGQLLSVGSILLATIVYVRYRQMKEVQIKFNRVNFESENNVCLFLGWGASFGISIVANFQETNVFVVHIIGAIFAFGFGSVYQVIMWRVSNNVKEDMGTTKNTNYCRLFLAVLSLTTFCFCFGFAAIALGKYHGKDVTKWKKEDGGYSVHLASTFTEWICAVSTMLYILTFYSDFKGLKMEEPLIELIK